MKRKDICERHHAANWYCSYCVEDAHADGYQAGYKAGYKIGKQVMKQ